MGRGAAGGAGGGLCSVGGGAGKLALGRRASTAGERKEPERGAEIGDCACLAYRSSPLSPGGVTSQGAVGSSNEGEARG